MADLETLPNRNPRNPSLCEGCNSTPWKYRCPGCSVKSCSLPCIKAHKSRTNCTGKRNRTEFVPLSKFDDNLLISDYNLLEETKRVADSARRMAGAITGFRGYIGFRLPKSILMLRSAANRRRTKLLLLPPAMSKRQTNRSRFDRRKNAIFWTIEWSFHATDVILVDHGVDEHASLFSVIEKHLAPTPLKTQLSPYRNVQIDDLKFFIRKTPKGLNSPFRELNIKDPIGIQLADVVILEYPVIFVFLPSHTCAFKVEKDVRPPLKKGLPGSFDKQLSPKGNLFTEEEIGEGEMPSDTLVTDLMGSVPNVHIQIQPGFSVGKKANHISDMQIPREAKRNCSSTANSVRPSNENNTQILQDYNMPISREVGESSKPGSSEKNQAPLAEDGEMNCSSPVNSMKPFGDVNFDFQQELKDVYTELMGEINPDDFLCFDGAYNELDNLENFLREDELEEGEIPGL